jgi:F-type H+-transporting ATPase subunit delta
VPEASNVARRYAEGVLDLAKETNSTDEWRRELARLDELLSDEVLAAAFQNPSVGTARRMELARMLAPELGPETDNFLRLLIEHQRTAQMPAILREYNRLADEAMGIVHARVTTAIALDNEDQRRYREALQRRLGGTVEVVFDTDASLVGGATIQIGDHLVDGTVRTQLDRMRQELLS